MFSQIANLTIIHRYSNIIYLDSYIGGDDLVVSANYSKDGGTIYSIPNGIFTINTTAAIRMAVSSTSITDTGVYKVGI